MKQNRKGFSALAVILGLAAIAGVTLFADFAYQKSQSTLGGASVLSTQLSDTFGTFRTNVNTSLTNLNTELETVSGTVNGFGNIVSQNIPLAINKGGTGTTTIPSDGQALVASGTIWAIKTIVASSGITIAQTPSSVIFSTQGFDATQNFTFSGNNNHTGSETFSSSTYLKTATNGVVTTDATGTVSAVQPGSVGNYLQSNGSSWIAASLGNKYISPNIATSTAGGSTTSTIASVTVTPATTNTLYNFIWYVSDNGGQAVTTTFQIGNNTLFTCKGYQTGGIQSGQIYMQNSTTSEFVNFSIDASCNQTLSGSILSIPMGSTTTWKIFGSTQSVTTLNGALTVIAL